jgi:lipid II:glycine glycyltransferase (peptidoglycan interpeptide bridge formation enzyme)
MKVSVSPLERSALESSASFLQSAFWGDFKADYGWTPQRFLIEAESSGMRASLLLLIRRLPAGYSFAYIPHGPELEISQDERGPFLAELSKALRPFLSRHCLFIRFDPPWYDIEAVAATEADAPSLEAEPQRPAIGKPLLRASADVQPPDTVLVDLRLGEEAILAAMKPKWRYNIRLAEKKGVAVEEAGVEFIPEFYELYRATSQRDKIALHPEGYYRRLFSLSRERMGQGEVRVPEIRLWLARHEGRSLAAIITVFYGETAVYLYGASSDEKRNLMPAYALQWAAMRAAKAAGCTRYDFFGIPPTADPEHPMAGLYRFKTGFGGEIAHRAGSWDYPLLSLSYACFRVAESARTWWFKDFKKRLKRTKKA